MASTAAMHQDDLEPRVPWIPQDTFGARLALVRQHMDWNLAEAAKACGLNDSSWANWERGGSCRDLYGVARKISEASGCDEAWLILGGPIRSRCFAPLALVDGGNEGQLELDFATGTRPRLTVAARA